MRRLRTTSIVCASALLTVLAASAARFQTASEALTSTTTPPPVSPPPMATPPAPPALPASPPPPAPSAPLPGVRPSIAVLPLDAALARYFFGAGPASRDGDCITIERAGTEIAKRCTQDLIESVVATQRFRVIDRDTVDRVLQEQTFHRTQGMDPKELTRLGHLLGADRLLLGSIDLVGTSCRRIEVRASGYVTFEFTGGIEIAYRVLKVATGEIETIGRVTRTWDSKAIPELRGVLSSPDGAATFFSRQGAAALTAAVLDTIDPVKVAAVQGDLIVLNQGRGRPMFMGTTFRVLLKIEPIRDPDTGAILSEEGPEVAVIQVVSVEEGLSRARLMAGDLSKIAIGARCQTIDIPLIPQ